VLLLPEKEKTLVGEKRAMLQRGHNSPFTTIMSGKKKNRRMRGEEKKIGAISGKKGVTSNGGEGKKHVARVMA